MKKIQSILPGKRTALTIVLCTTVTGLPFIESSAFAQSDSTVDENSIIVTAQRRSEALEAVPMSIAVISSETMAAAGVNNLRDLANVTSGYSLGSGGSFPQPAIRGVTALVAGNNFENNVAVYVDGLYQPLSLALSIDLPNADNVQILKGPQGTLYGRNATGGAILLTTIDPGRNWQGRGEITYARFDDKRASGYVAGPLGEKIGISVAGYVRRADSYEKLASRTVAGGTAGNAAPIEQDALRVKLKASLTENFSATAAYAYTRVSDSRANVYSPIENTATLYGALPAGTPRPTTLGIYAYDPKNILATKQHEGGLTLDWDTGIGKFRSITGLSKISVQNSFDFDGSYIPLSYSDFPIQEKTFQQAADLSVDAIKNIDLVIGATYFHDKLVPIRPGTSYSGKPAIFATSSAARVATLDDFTVASALTYRQKKDAIALYADATFHATDHLSLDVGGRYSEEKQNVFSQTVASTAAAARPANSQSAKFSKFTPRATIRYEVSHRTNVYASYSQGFRSGAFNSNQPVCVQTTPNCYIPASQESVAAYELGFKSAANALRFELAGFYYNYKNLQVSTTRIVNGFPISDISNSPKATIYGAEGSFDLKVAENLNARGSATWLHARYGAGTLISGVGVSNSAAQGGGIGVNTNSDPLKTYLNVSQVQDLSGLQMARAPNFTASLGLDYLIPIGDGGVRFAGNLKYTTSYVLTNPSVWSTGSGVPVDRQRQQRFREGAFTLFNASITWTDSTDHYYGRIWGNNLSDHRYRIHYTGNGSFGTYSPMAEPRTFGVTLGYKFHG
jgi:iron complex outermembrane receptor protein